MLLRSLLSVGVLVSTLAIRWFARRHGATTPLLTAIGVAMVVIAFACPLGYLVASGALLVVATFAEFHQW